MKPLLSVCVLVFLVLSLHGNDVRAQEELVVFAAASLIDAYEEIGAAFEESNPDVEVLFNFGGSSTLAAQLVQGAPADIFASANDAQMKTAVESERISLPVRTFAKNRLVLIVPKNNPANIQSLGDLANPSVQLILAAPEVPVRAYTDTMLERMANDPTFGEAFRTAVINNIVSEEPNVRQVAAKIALGEADAGIVYLSDVTPDIVEEVVTLQIPDAFNTIAAYPIAMTNDTQNAELAERFIEFILSDAGQDILVAWGFVSVQIQALHDTVNVPNDGTLLVDGQVSNPLSLTLHHLQSDYAAHTVNRSYDNVDETVDTTFTGVLLWDLLSAAQPDIDADVPHDALSMFVVVTGFDGHQVVFSWGEIDPDYANQPVLVAYRENDRPIADPSGNLRLVVPSDAQEGRFIHGVANISLRDAPSPAGK